MIARGRYLVFAAAMALVGCLNQSSTSNDAGMDVAADRGDDGAAMDSASVDARTFSCPPSPPEAGAPCVPPRGGCDGGSCMSLLKVCEYGEDPNLACNTLYVCDDAGTWTPRAVGVADASCPTAPNDSKCAIDFASVPRGQACAPTDPALCSYTEGFCGCAKVGNSADGGSVMKWSCEAPVPGCPVPRPKLGSACNLDSALECDYWGCGLQTGVWMYCPGPSGHARSLKHRSPQV